MTQSIINQYKINFFNRIDSDGEVIKSPDTINEWLSMFLFEWNPNEINNLLLPDINSVLNTPNIEIETGTQAINITIYNDNVEIYDYDGNLAYTLSTRHFKEIVTGWRDFLLTRPLHGTRA